MKPIMVCLLTLAVLISVSSAQAPFPGNNLISIRSSNETQLVDLERNVVHTWHGATGPREVAYLLEDGSILRPTGDENATWGAGGGGGRIQRIDANDNVVWDYLFSTDTYIQHHDIEPMPNGNVLIIAWDRKTEEEAKAHGRLNVPTGEFWPTLVAEVEPAGPTGGNIVWEWHLWEHMIQDTDPAKPNYGVVADHPELVDINRAPARSGSWDHANSIDYNPGLDQILMSCQGLREVLIIDHSTTTEEAAGHTGGNSGKGGDLLYRWGNPQNYDRGTAADQFLLGVHGGEWIEPCLPGGGNVLLFNNGQQRGYSSVEEIVPPMDAAGNYIIEPDAPYGPDLPVWSYSSGAGFFSQSQGGAYRLPNGNTLITDARSNILFEVTHSKTLVWFQLLSAQAHRVNRYWDRTTVTLDAHFDIKPGSCPNPFNIKWLEHANNENENGKSKKGGVLPAAIIGDACIDVTQIDVSTLRLGGVEPLRSSYEDVAAPAGDGSCSCTSDGPDGHMDLTLKFSRMEIAGILGSVGDGDVVALNITGYMNDGSPIKGTDCISILSHNREPKIGGPGDFVLYPATPNPFNPTTTIRFDIPADGHVTLVVYDVRGKRVRTLVDEFRTAASHVAIWDGRDHRGSAVSSGVYFYRITAGSFAETRRMVMLK